MSRGFDRFMVDVEASSNPKIKRFKRAGKEVRWAWFHGVLPIAARAPMRGSFCVGAVSADEHDVAAVADVTTAEARKTLQTARQLGMLDRDEHGIEWVHDFEVYNPEPKVDATAADRAKRYRERQRMNRDVTASSRRDARDANGAVTPPEVEEEENTPRNPPASGGELPPVPLKPTGNRRTDHVRFEEQVQAYAAAAFPSLPDPNRWQLVKGAIGRDLCSHRAIADYVRHWAEGATA